MEDLNKKGMLISINYYEHKKITDYKPITHMSSPWKWATSTLEQIATTQTKFKACKLLITYLANGKFNEEIDLVTGNPIILKETNNQIIILSGIHGKEILEIKKWNICFKET